MVAAAKEGTIGCSGKGCLYLLLCGEEVVGLLTVTSRHVFIDNLLQSGEELVTLGDVLRHRASHQQQDGREVKEVISFHEWSGFSGFSTYPSSAAYAEVTAEVP